MHLGKLSLRLSVSLQQALCLVGMNASEKGGYEGLRVKADADAVASEIGNVRIVVEVPAAHVFAQACDELRKQGDKEAVAKLEELVKSIKAGDNQKVLAKMNFGATSIGQIDDALEGMRKIAIKTAGG